MKMIYFAVTLLLVTSLAGCAQQNTVTQQEVPETIVTTIPVASPDKRENIESPEYPHNTADIWEPAVYQGSQYGGAVLDDRRFFTTPVVPVPSLQKSRAQNPKQFHFAGAPAKVAFDAIPLPAFINEVYGNIFGATFEIDSTLRKKTDLVTLHAGSLLTPDELDVLARQVLANYGVMVKREGDLLRFLPGTAVNTGGPPLLISGRTLPEVPISHRTIFQQVPLQVVRNTAVAGWLRKAFKQQDLIIDEDPARNAILLKGPPAIVGQALETIRFLDQPPMRGRFAVRIDPLYVDAQSLAKSLVDVLNSEGYEASLKPPTGSIIVLPVAGLNMVMVFAADHDILQHVQEWAQTLDKAAPVDQRDGFFYYQVRNTPAEELAEILDAMLSGGGAASLAGGTQQGINGEKAKVTGIGRQSKLVVDKIRNGLIYRGDSQTWQQVLPILHQMDKAARMVLIEVLVAEVTLTDKMEFGVEWLLRNSHYDESGENVLKENVLHTMGSLGIGSSGLNYAFNQAGQTFALLNAFATKSNIGILSTPRIMVKSGGEATIDVGSEIPIVTRQSTDSDLQVGGTSAILQEIQYRKTGVLLKVKPVIHSGNQIDLVISQEVSESQPNTTSSIDSPTILTRKVQTSLSLADGGSVLLGGLISSSTTEGYGGVPWLSDIPLIGHLFKVEKDDSVRTEMVMLIVPYILDNSLEAEMITEEFKKRLSIEIPEQTILRKSISD